MLSKEVTCEQRPGRQEAVLGMSIPCREDIKCQAFGSLKGQQGGPRGCGSLSERTGRSWGWRGRRDPGPVWAGKRPGYLLNVKRSH